MINLSDRACLVHIRIKNPSFKKTSRALANEVEAEHGATDRTVNAVVRLVPEQYLKPLAKHAQRLRRIVEFYSAEWAGSWRIVLYSRVADIKAEITPALTDWETTVDAFVAQYAAIRAEAQAQLNGLAAYVVHQWPTDEEVRALFDAKLSIMPLADVASDFRLALSEDEAAAMRLDLQAELESNLQASQRDARDRAVAVLQRFVDSVSKYKVVADPSAPTGIRTEGAFWQSTVTNVREIAQVCRSLNFLGDADFDRVCSEMERLGAVEAEHLKLSDQVRADAIVHANDLMASLLK